MQRYNIFALFASVQFFFFTFLDCCWIGRIGQIGQTGQTSRTSRTGRTGRIGQTILWGGLWWGLHGEALAYEKANGAAGVAEVFFGVFVVQV